MGQLDRLTNENLRFEELMMQCPHCAHPDSVVMARAMAFNDAIAKLTMNFSDNAQRQGYSLKEQAQANSKTRLKIL